MLHVALRLLAAVLAAVVLLSTARAQPLVLAPAEAPPASVRLQPEQGAQGAAARTPESLHYARLDAAALDAAVASAERGARAEVTLEVGGRLLRSEAVWVERRGRERLTWSGTVVGDPLGHVLLTVEGPAVAGRVVTQGLTYGVGYAGGGRQVVYEVELAPSETYCRTEVNAAPEEGGTEWHPEARRWDGDVHRVGADTVRVLIAYTADVRVAVGEEGLAALLQGVIDSANDVLVRTEVAGRLALAFAAEAPTPDPDEVPDLVAALEYLKRWDDGVFDEVHEWRIEHEAHFVSLLTESPGYCGAAFIPLQMTVSHIGRYGFSAVRRHCAISGYSFAHEVGHNLGLLHDPYANRLSGPFRFGHGYVSISDEAEGQFRTVMAYTNECVDAGMECPRVPYFSNASLTLEGHALGEPEYSDAALALATSMPFVASIEVGGVTEAPELHVTTREDEPLVLTPDPSALATPLSAPEHGTVQVQGDTALVYQPALNYHGADSFSYALFGSFGIVSGEVHVEVEAVPDAPYASEITATGGNPFDLNEMEGPLEVQWSEMRHPDFAAGEVSLEATWEIKALYHRIEETRVFAGDTTRLRVPIALLDEVLAAAGTPPGAFSTWAYHRVIVSDGERTTEGPQRTLRIRRLEQRGPGGEGQDEDEQDEEEVTPRAPVLRAVYPNPARGAFIVELGVPDERAARVTLYDALGRPALIERAGLEGGYNRVRLDVSGLPAGLYLYRVEVGAEVFRGRVVVL